MENKQTAVEWLQNKLPSLFEHDDNDFYKKLFEQAKEIDKENMIELIRFMRTNDKMGKSLEDLYQEFQYKKKL